MSATQRSLEDARSKHELMGKYIAECERIDRFRENVVDSPTAVYVDDYSDFCVTMEERMAIFNTRRERLLKELENKGIRIQAESDSLPSIARAIEQQNA